MDQQRALGKLREQGVTNAWTKDLPRGRSRTRKSETWSVPAAAAPTVDTSEVECWNCGKTCLYATNYTTRLQGKRKGQIQFRPAGERKGQEGQEGKGRKGQGQRQRARSRARVRGTPCPRLSEAHPAARERGMGDKYKGRGKGKCKGRWREVLGIMLP